MPQPDYTKDLSLIFAGTGPTTKKNLGDLLEDFIFGPPAGPGEEEIERDVTILIPAQYEDAPGVRTLMSWGTPMGMEFSIIPGEPHTSMDKALTLLEQSRNKGDETAFIMFYNPKSQYEKDDPSLTDLEVIGTAKQYDWLTTLNLSEGMVDFFDGYESAEEREHRKEVQAKYDAELAAKEAAEKPPRKTAAKKATTPRKRAASKPKVAEDTELPIEPEKPLVEPHKHRFVWGDDGMGHEGSVCECGMEEPSAVVKGLDNLIAQAVQREQDKKLLAEPRLQESLAQMKEGKGISVENYLAKTELSGTIVMGSKLPENLATVETADVWSEVARASGDVTHFSVPKADIVELGEAMEEMANAFGKAIRVYKNIVEGK